VSLVTLRNRLERLESRDDVFRIVWICPTCRHRVRHYEYGEPCESHALAPPTRPGERVLVVESILERGAFVL
jgi:hypothetical protein